MCSRFLLVIFLLFPTALIAAEKDYSLLEKTIFYGDKKSVQLLLEQDPDIVSKTDLLKSLNVDHHHKMGTYGGTLLHHVISNPYSDLEAIELLLKAGADPNVRDGNQKTPFHAFLGALMIIPNYKEHVELLIKYGADFRSGVQIDMRYARNPKNRIPRTRFIPLNNTKTLLEKSEAGKACGSRAYYILNQRYGPEGINITKKSCDEMIIALKEIVTMMEEAEVEKTARAQKE